MTNQCSFPDTVQDFIHFSPELNYLSLIHIQFVYIRELSQTLLLCFLIAVVGDCPSQVEVLPIFPPFPFGSFQSRAISDTDELLH